MDEWLATLRDYAANALRPAEGKLALEGVQDEIEILTDSWGVPHVFANCIEDALFAQGWLFGTERLWQYDFTRRLVQGRLAEVVGEAGLPTDRFFRTLGALRTARRLARGADEETRRAAAALRSGLVAGARCIPFPVEYLILGLEPDLSTDLDDALVDTASIVLLMAFTQATNWPFELIRAELSRRLGPDAARALSPFTGSADTPLAVPQSPALPGLVKELTDAALAAGTARPGVGSNNWVVAGTKSVTGAPLLANDPHMVVQMPSIWYELHLSCPGLDVAGVSLVGVPGIVLGHNRRIAWGFTNSWADAQDLYLERLSDDGTRYEYRGKWHPVRVVREKIVVRGEDRPRVHEVRMTRHGPFVTDTIAGTADPHIKENVAHAPLALRWTQHTLPVDVGALLALNRAGTWDEFRAAMRRWTVASFNVVYADVDGNIGYQMCGVVPVRARGSGAAPLPGWTGEHEWKGTIPFEEMPHAFNPRQGFIATANHRIVGEDYPYYITNDWEPPARIRRIVQLLTERDQLSREDFVRIQLDTHSPVADTLLPLLLRARVSDPGVKEALERVRTWNRRLDADAVGGAIFNVWLYKVSEALFRDKLGEDLFDLYHRLKSLGLAWAYDALRDVLTNPDAAWMGGDGADNATARDELLGRALGEACEDLRKRFGDDMDEWRWGRLHTVHFRHPMGRAVPPLDALLSAGPFELPGGDDTINRGVFAPGEDYAGGAVSAWRMIIDLGDLDRSLGVITTGQSGNPASPHYGDQCDLWLRGEYHALPFTRDAVEAAATRRLTLTPAARNE